MSIIMHISMLCSWTNISSVIFYDDAFFKMMKYSAIILYKMLLPILMCSIIVFLLFNCFTRWHVNYFSIGKKIFIIQTCKKYLWIKYQENFFPIHIGFKCKHIGFLLLRFLFFYKPKFIYISTSQFYAESFLRLRVHPTSVHFFETVYYSFFKIKDKMLKKWFLW